MILDLDDTIFRTDTMNPQVFDVAISNLRKYYLSIGSAEHFEQVMAAIWSTPIDQVFEQFDTPVDIMTQFYNDIASIDYRMLEIIPFADYEIVRSYPMDKILVTTGIKELQLAKIKSLGITDDFIAIYIDDPRDQPRKHKIGIFNGIMKELGWTAEDVWVIGDNPESELKAGKDLGMRAIQRYSDTKAASEYADYKIQSFAELPQLFI